MRKFAASSVLYSFRPLLGVFPLCAICTFLGSESFAQAAPGSSAAPAHTFAIGPDDFLLDGKAFVIRCGEMHFTRVPREYWRHRLQLVKSLGMNSVCAYLFWNYHEFEQGKYDWSGQADIVEFCRIAQQEGLWVVLRPGPYVCAEWDGGGLPWWLLKNEKIKMRTQDPDFMKAATSWFKEVGRVLAPMQITKGGPILMVQVENEYGSYGGDAEYVGKLRDLLASAGFDVPFFACNPVGDLNRGRRTDLFNVVNFGNDAEGAFKKLRELQPKGPLMCGEFYPGWFDTWGAPHHLGKTPQFLKDLEYMMKNRCSFSLYMAHGGTTFGMWPGADRPFKPDTSSYDYDAPISEAGWTGEKFKLTREVVAKHLPAGEKLPEPPAANPTMSVAAFSFKEVAPVFENLPQAVADKAPRNMEAYDQGHGCTLYRTELPAGPAEKLRLDHVHDFAWVFLDGKQVGATDRRARQNVINLPAREKAARLDILVEAMGHVNFGLEIHDRKGITTPVRLVSESGQTSELKGAWQVYPLLLDAKELSSLKWKSASANVGPAFWRAEFNVAKPADTFLDLRNWGKGVVWVNGHCLARYWNIGPTQTAYIPGPWLREGKNEIIVLDLLGPTSPTAACLEKPILDQLRPELDFARHSGPKATLALAGQKPVHSGSFAAGSDVQTVKFDRAVEGKQFCLETLNAHDGKEFAAVAELDLLDPNGNSIPHTSWRIAYVDSQELVGEDGSASNAIDGQTANFWHTQWQDAKPKHPHHLVIDCGKNVSIGGFRYTPRAGSNDVAGRIKDYRIYVGESLAKEAN